MTEQLIGDRYEIKEGLGRGAMGSVYLAFDPKVSREVAIKILQEDFAKSPKHRQRFEREARAIAALKHPNIVEIYDFGGSPDRHLYLVMELINGPHLGRLCRSFGPLPEAVLAAVGIELAAALACAHEHGIIHRDLKPENVFLDGGRLVLADFGIAKAIAPENPLGAEAARPQTDVIGTPGFMAPEQLEQRQLDNRTDIFAFGALLYYLACGKLPFEAESPYALLKMLRSTPPQPLAVLRPGLSPKLCELIHRCLAYEPDERPTAADQLRMQLRAILDQLGVSDAREVLFQYGANPEGFTPPLPAAAGARAVRDTATEIADVRAQERRRRALLFLPALILTAALAYWGWRYFAPQPQETSAAPAKVQNQLSANVVVRSALPTHVFIDGEAVGETPHLEPLQVAPGKRHFEFMHDKYGRISRKLTLTAGQGLTLTVDWKRHRVRQADR